MKSLLAAVLLATSLSGCYQMVDSIDLERAAYVCESAENIVQIQVHALGAENVTCKTTGYHSQPLDKVQLPKR